MGFWDKLLGRDKEQRATQLNVGGLNYSIGDTSIVEGSYGSSISVNEKSVLGIPAVKRAVTVISSTIAGLPVNIQKDTGMGYPEVQMNHNLRYLLNHEPNAVNDKVVFFETLITNTLLHGNGFAVIDRDADYKVTGCVLLHPDLVTVKVLKGGGVRYELRSIPGRKKFYRPEEIIHIQGNGTNGFLGFSNLDLNRKTFELALHVIQFGSSYFENGGFLSGVVKHPGQLSDPAAKRLKNSLGKYSGSDKAGKQLILDEGMSYETLTVNPAQAGFVEVNQYLISEFSRIFGVPPFMLQDLSKSTMQNVESLTLSFVKHTIVEHLNKIESELSRKLLTEAEKHSGYKICFNLDDLLKADSRTRGEYIRNLFNVGAISIDEIRLMEGLAPLKTKGSGKHFVQINMGDIEVDQQEQKDQNLNTGDEQE